MKDSESDSLAAELDPKQKWLSEPIASHILQLLPNPTYIQKVE